MGVIIPVLLMIVFVGVLIHIVSLAGRLVRAVEKIADKVDNIPPPRVSARVVSEED